MATPYEWNNDSIRGMFPVVGVSRHHHEGNRGRGVKVVVYDNGFDRSRTMLKDQAIVDVNGSTERDTGSIHGLMSADLVHQIAPDAEIHFVCQYRDNWISMMRYAMEIDADIVTASLGSIRDRGTMIQDMSRRARDQGILLLSSAGNEGTEGVTWPARKATWQAVGACIINRDTRRFIRLPYSSVGPEIEVMMLSNAYVQTYTGISTYGGTSGACAAFAGVMSLYISRFGHSLDWSRTFDRYAAPMEDDWNKSGWGCFRLPNKNHEPMKEIVLTIDSDKAIVDGEEVEIDAPATILNDRTMVPVSFVGRQMGKTVDWDGEKRRVTIRG